MKTTTIRSYVIGCLIILMIVFPCKFAHPQTAIGLTSLKVDKINDQKTNYTGLCGNATVIIMGVTEINNDIFEVNNGSLIVKTAAKELILTEMLSDYNGVACVKTRSADRLLIWSNCNGSACGEDFHFNIIDPQKLTVLAPKKGKLCDDKCASKILGNRLPQKINSR
jgi:hypothetical protein